MHTFGWLTLWHTYIHSWSL